VIERGVDEINYALPIAWQRSFICVADLNAILAKAVV